MLDEAVARHKGEVGEPVTDEDLRELGDEIPDEPKELPEFMRYPWSRGISPVVIS